MTKNAKSLMSASKGPNRVPAKAQATIPAPKPKAGLKLPQVTVAPKPKQTKLSTFEQLASLLPSDVTPNNELAAVNEVQVDDMGGMPTPAVDENEDRYTAKSEVFAAAYGQPEAQVDQGDILADRETGMSDHENPVEALADLRAAHEAGSSDLTDGQFEEREAYLQRLANDIEPLAPAEMQAIIGEENTRQDVIDDAADDDGLELTEISEETVNEFAVQLAEELANVKRTTVENLRVLSKAEQKIIWDAFIGWFSPTTPIKWKDLKGDGDAIADQFFNMDRAQIVQEGGLLDFLQANKLWFGDLTVYDNEPSDTNVIDLVDGASEQASEPVEEDMPIPTLDAIIDAEEEATDPVPDADDEEAAKAAALKQAALQHHEATVLEILRYELPRDQERLGVQYRRMDIETLEDMLGNYKHFMGDPDYSVLVQQVADMVAAAATNPVLRKAEEAFEHKRSAVLSRIAVLGRELGNEAALSSLMTPEYHQSAKDSISSLHMLSDLIVDVVKSSGLAFDGDRRSINNLILGLKKAWAHFVVNTEKVDNLLTRLEANDLELAAANERTKEMSEKNRVLGSQLEALREDYQQRIKLLPGQGCYISRTDTKEYLANATYAKRVRDAIAAGGTGKGIKYPEHMMYSDLIWVDDEREAMRFDDAEKARLTLEDTIEVAQRMNSFKGKVAGVPLKKIMVSAKATILLSAEDEQRIK